MHSDRDDLLLHQWNGRRIKKGKTPNNNLHVRGPGVGDQWSCHLRPPVLEDFPPGNLRGAKYLNSLAAHIFRQGNCLRLHNLSILRIHDRHHLENSCNQWNQWDPPDYRGWNWTYSVDIRDEREWGRGEGQFSFHVWPLLLPVSKEQDAAHHLPWALRPVQLRWTRTHAQRILHVRLHERLHPWNLRSFLLYTGVPDGGRLP